MGEKSANSISLRVAVVQDGARLHYAVPAALERSGSLSLMFSEWFIKEGSLGKMLRWGGRKATAGRGAGLWERRCNEIPASRVRTNPLLALKQRGARKRFASDEAFYAWASSMVGKWVRRRGLGDANALFGFIRNIDPDLCLWARESGRVVVGDQIIAPAVIEADEARRQLQRWPQWEKTAVTHDWQVVEDVERRTWTSLDRISCASNYVRDGLIGLGVDAAKISVCPYPIDAARYAQKTAESGGVITVGFVGAVGLRKGAPYFCHVARRLASDRIKFVMVGPLQIDAKAAGDYADCVQFVGRVSRSEVGQWLGKFDLYLFPSTCEGSAGSAMEAMACGLPVIASPNSGTIMRHGVDGFLHAYDDIDALAASVDRLAGDEALRREMGRQARAAAEQMTLDHYGRRLVKIFHSAMSD
ncbi:MAG TPA: glycosyltransferase family 4 protein [Tepidisphaeraceae bacterium]|nr:glycosyltransferase family 4 protein [Tepidisphaeraceae bacterium]